MTKQVKRVFSVLLALSVLLCSGVTFVNTAVSATSDVVFELDAATLTDKSSNGIAASTLGTIVKGSFVNEAGDTVSYMTTGNADDALNNSPTAGMLRLTDDKVTKLKDYTIETWMRYKLPADNVYPRMFRHTDGSTNLFAFEMPKTETGDKVIALGKEPIKAQTKNTDVADMWMHYVFTFDTVYDTDGETVTKVIPKIYLNGADLTAGYSTEPAVTDTAALALLGTGTEFTIGGSANASGQFSRAFSGDFATFKIYNTVKTGTEIKALYDDSAADYVEGLDVEEGGVLLDVDPATLTDRSGNNIALSTLGTITKDSFTNSLGETVSYMTTGQGNDTLNDSSTAGLLRTTDKNIIKLKDYTIETWMRYKTPADNIYPRMFRHTDGSTNLFAFEMPKTETGDKVIALGKEPIKAQTNNTDVADVWMHYVFTFDTVYGTDGETVTKVIPKIYLNGADLTAGYSTEPAVTDTAALALLGTGTEFTIGGSTNASGQFSRAFSGDFATFKIYKGVKNSTEAKALYDNSVGDYTEWSTEARRPSIGQMEISLGKEIQADSLAGNIKLEKVVANTDETETVTPAKGGIYGSVSADNSSKAVLKFGMLEDSSSYRITFDADVAFTDGSTLGTEKTIEFSTGKSVLIDTEFDDYTTDNLTKDGLSYRCNGVMDATTGITIENVTLEDGTTDNVLRFTAPESSKTNNIWFKLDEPVEKDEVLKIEEKARSYDKSIDKYNGDVNGSNARMIRFEGENSTSTAAQVPANAGLVYFSYGQYQDDNGFMDVVSNVTYGEDTDTFYASRTKADGSYTMESYDTTLNNITGLMPVELYLTTADVVGSYVELSKYKVTRGIAPAILNAEYDEAAEIVTVVFNDDMTGIDADSLELFNRVSAENDVKVEGTQVSYDASARTAVISLFEPLAVGDYLVNVTDAVSPTAGKWNGYSEFSVAASTAFTRSVKFKADDVDIVEGAAIPAGTTSLSATVTFSNYEDESVVVFAALYNESGNLVKVTAPQNVPDEVADGVATLNIDGVTTVDGYVMKVFVWDSMTDLTPVFTVKSIGVSNQE